MAPTRARTATGSLDVFLHPSVALLALLVAVFAAYAPALGGDFLWDDTFLVKGNLMIRSPLFCLEVFRHTLFNGESNFYRPAQMLTYLVDYFFWGANPFGYHLTNTLIQGLNGWLLFVLLRRILPALVPSAVDVTGASATARLATDWMALGVAFLWMLHPIHSAAVAYVSGRADILAMTGCLSAWLLCERALGSSRPGRRAGWAAAAFLGFEFGLCSKEIAIVWLVLFAIWLVFLRPEPAGRGWNKVAVAGGGAVAVAVYVGLRHLAPPPPVLPPMPAMPAKWLLMLRALGDYGSLLIFPDRLFMERQVFTTPGQIDAPDPSFYLSLAVAGGLVLTAFALGAWWPGRGRLLRRCGAGWFLIGFLPVSNLFALNASVAEHWLYLPSIGFLLFALGTAIDFPWARILAAPGQSPRLSIAAIVLLAIGGLGVRTWFRACDWENPLTFYRQTIRDGGNVPRAREGLALAYAEMHNDAAATLLLRGIVARFPHALAARVNLATALLRQRQTSEGTRMLEQIARELPADDHAGPREVSVTVRTLDKLEPDKPEWIAQRQVVLDAANRRFGDSWEMVQLAVQRLERDRDSERALALSSHYADAHWWHQPARCAMGRALVAVGRPQEALAAFTDACWLDLHDPDAPEAAAVLCLSLGRVGSAVEFQTEAVARQPGSPRQRIVLAEMLERAGRAADSKRERAVAASLIRPDNA